MPFIDSGRDETPDADTYLPSIRMYFVLHISYVYEVYV